MTIPMAIADPGSFRDPGGRVFMRDGRVYRAVYAPAAENWDFVSKAKVVNRLAAEGRIVDFSEAPRDILGAQSRTPSAVLEHPPLPFISYPYEWSFRALKAAALHHLALQIELLAEGIGLSDASAYNVQFIGARPIFIDVLSLRRYQEGEFWTGHRQFCEQFLNPLLLRALTGIAHNAWYRGTLEGIATDELSSLLSWRHKLMSWNVLTQVALQASLQRSARSKVIAVDAGKIRKLSLSRPAFQRMLEGLARWISSLNPAGGDRTVWQDYAQDNSYADAETDKKRCFVAEYVQSRKPRQLWDLGCNTGDYSDLALSVGAEYALGFDFDHGALDAAFDRAERRQLSFQSLFMDAANPSPDQGLRQHERKGLQSRANANGILALALVHHLAITRNVPLAQIVDWLVGLAPTGVVEFVPKSDPMVQELLKLREDIFSDYHSEAFIAALSARARIVRQDIVSSGGRILFQFDRRS